MESIYLKIWNLAKPYYEKGRPMDIDHIEWMVEAGEKVADNEGLDKTIFLPLIILHDVGYSQLENLPEDTHGLDTRRAHMAAGAKLARQILEGIDYDPTKIDTICYFVSVHDNWALGDNEVYYNNPILAAFQDLDFMWTATPKGFPACMKMLKLSPQEMLDYIVHNDKLIKRPWANGTAKGMFEQYVSDRRTEYNLDS